MCVYICVDIAHGWPPFWNSISNSHSCCPVNSHAFVFACFFIMCVKSALIFPLSVLTKDYCDEISNVENAFCLLRMLQECVLPNSNRYGSCWFCVSHCLSCIVSNFMPFVCLYKGGIVRSNHLLCFLELFKIWYDFNAFWDYLCLKTMQLDCLLFSFSFFLSLCTNDWFMIETGLTFARIQPEVLVWISSEFILTFGHHNVIYRK